ncbi:uncharacterized protein LOC127566655 [Pristis pectinata]|uniref:uncharacterized protein LOC127566655 n=1 Tax=Pristis pectinata TaxID=685728 RepID=UPI00223C8C50|nr:uncharacterized protein LOC127566655 [Pristis pectinata]
MAEGADRGGDPVTTTTRKDKGPMPTMNELLEKWDDSQLLQLTNHYRERLEQAIEEAVDKVGFVLTYKRLFSVEDYARVIKRAERGSRAACSKLLLSLVVEKDPQSRRRFWKCFVKMQHMLPKLDKLLDLVEKQGSYLMKYLKHMYFVPELSDHLKGVQQKHKETLRAQTETLRVNTILMREKQKVFQLVDRYVELTVISTVRDRRLVEHELLARGREHEVRREEQLSGELEKIRTDQLFQSSLSRSKSKSGSSTAVVGVPGIGKTTMLQKIVYDWATGKIYKQFQFVFTFKFRDLNSIDCRITLSELILDQYPYLRNVLEMLWTNAVGLLFIFDGLDEFKHRINFGGCRRDTKPQYMCTNPEFRCKVSDIVYSLIQHKLLPGCSVLVTTRPTALNLLEKAGISVWAEILGFVGEQQKEYFNRFFEDPTVAAAVFKHVEENEILYTMSYNPSYCWILGLALGPFFTQRHRDPQRVPKTITQLYSYYIYNILKNHGREIENPHDVLLRVGQMAFTGVSKRKIVFTDGDLIEYNLQPSQFLSGFLIELLEREDSGRSVVYTFPHLTIQEFAAALALFLTPDPGSILKFLSEAHSTTDGRFEIFLRFVAGLSSPGSARHLEEILGPFPHQRICRVIDWVKEEVRRQIGNTWSEAGKRSLLNTLHYLVESQNRGLAQAAMGSVETLSFIECQLTPIDCAVLTHVIGFCDTTKRLDLDNCHIESEGLQRLVPVLHKCWELRLGSNKLGDSGVKLVSAALRVQECKIQRLWLRDIGLTDSGAEDLASALGTNKSLMEIHLSGNKLGISAVKLVSAALRNPLCRIQQLELDEAILSADCCEDLVSVLSKSNSRMQLELRGNELGDSGVKLLTEALRITKYKIQRLVLRRVGLTYSGVEDLVSALSANQSLTELNLGFNELGDSGVKLLSAALRGPEYEIQRLVLDHVGLTDSAAEVLASALSTQLSLTELDLTGNSLGDSGVKLLSAALSNPECNIQRLELYNVGLTDSGAEYLVSALSTNRSLTELEMSFNSLTDGSVPALRRLILTLPSLQWIWLMGNEFSELGQNELRTLQESRPGVTVNMCTYQGRNITSRGMVILLDDIPPSLLKVCSPGFNPRSSQSANRLRDRILAPSTPLTPGSLPEGSRSQQEQNSRGDNPPPIRQREDCSLVEVGLRSCSCGGWSSGEQAVDNGSLGGSASSGHCLLAPMVILSPRAGSVRFPVKAHTADLLGLTGSRIRSLAEGPMPTMNELLEKWDDSQLLQLTNHYRERLEQAIEEAVDKVGFVLTYKRLFSVEDYAGVIKRAERGSRAADSKLLLSLVIEKDPQSRRRIWKCFVKMQHMLPKLDKLLDEVEKQGSDLMKSLKHMYFVPELSEHLKGIQQKHKETLRAQTETVRVNTFLTRETVKEFQLVDGYAELTVISTIRYRRLVEHELLARGRDHEVWRKEHLGGKMEKIRTDQFFQSSFTRRKSKSGSSAAVAGVPGIGKTTMVQKIVYDWATGKIYQHFQFVFSFKFRDLNTINGRINLRELVLDQYPYFGNILGEVWKNPEGLLFIFDGLDEFKHTIDFADRRRDTEPQHMCPDPECWCEVSDIVYSLIQHKLLPGCSVLVTTRPTALHLLEKAKIRVWAEILGFVGEQRKKYFSRFFEDQTVAEAVFKHVEENEILYTMSYNPSYCWILGLALGPFFTQRHRDPQRVPKTITQLYSYYIYNILKNHSRQIGSPRDVLLRVGQMAFTGVSKRKIVFTDGDLIKYNLQPSQFLSGFLMELLEREDSARSVVYTFPHLTIQEFVAALAQFLTPDPGDILKFLTEVHSEEDGRFEIVLRFVAGLSSPGSSRGLGEFLSPFSHQAICRVIDWVKQEVKRQIGNTESDAGKMSLLNSLHYLFESQNPGLAQAALESVETLSFSGFSLTPIDCAVLSYAFGFCEAINLLNLCGCHIKCEGLQRLGPGLNKCRELRLASNELGDSGLKLVSAALKDPECKIQRLELGDIGLTVSGAEDLASALSTNRSLIELDLSCNELGDSGVKLVSEALGDPECKIQSLELTGVGLTDSGAEDLVSVLITNRSLTELDLSSNVLADGSVQHFRYLILHHPSLERIRLLGNDFSRTGEKELRSLQEPRPGVKVILRTSDRETSDQFPALRLNFNAPGLNPSSSKPGLGTL